MSLIRILEKDEREMNISIQDVLYRLVNPDEDETLLSLDIPIW